MDPVDILCSIYQSGHRPLEVYVVEFLSCCHHAPLDQWTLMDCFWGGLDESIAQLMPGGRFQVDPGRIYRFGWGLRVFWGPGEVLTCPDICAFFSCL